MFTKVFAFVVTYIFMSGYLTFARNLKDLDQSNAIVNGKGAGTIIRPALHPPTGIKTRKTYDFTRAFEIGTSCHEIQRNQNASLSGVYLIHPKNLIQGPWKVYCDLQTEGGGWMVFQVRDDVRPRENFMRNWEDYKIGFGDFDREFWLGNILLSAITNDKINRTRYELEIDMEDWSDNRRFARYKNFRLGNEEDKFRLYFQNLYYGNAGDSLHSHRELPFSTFDVDNDSRDGDFSERSCSRLYKGGWWYGNCHDSNLNGRAKDDGFSDQFADGINWYTWTGYHYSLRKVVMKIRPQTTAPIDVGYRTYLLTGRKGKKMQHEVNRRIGNDEHVDVSPLLSRTNTLTKPDLLDDIKNEL